MFRRHVTRLVSIMLMVLVSVGLLSGIGISTEKINLSVSDFAADRNVSDIIVMNTEGAFTEDDLALLSERYGAENVLRGGMLEFTVADGKATVNDTQFTLTNVPDGVVRVYLYDCERPEDVGINTFSDIQTFYLGDSEAIRVYAERETTQFPAHTRAETYTLSATMTEHLDQFEYMGMTLEGDLDVTIPLEQEYILAGTLYNPQHMAIRDDVSYTEGADEEEYELLSAVYYVFGDLVDVTVTAQVTGTVTVPALVPGMEETEREIDTTQEETIAVGAEELLNEIYISLPDADETLFSLGYDARVDEETAAVEALFADRCADGTVEILTLEENYSFRSFHEYSEKILGIGIPNGLENSMFQLGKIIVLSLVSTFGTYAIAANAVSNTLASFQVLPGMAITLAVTTVIARCVGAGDYGQVNYYTKKLTLITYGCMVVTNVIIVLALPLILKVYNLSDKTAAVTSDIVIFYAVCCVLIWPLAFTIPATFRASGDAKMCMIISVASMWIFRIVFSYILGKYMGMGVFGVWVAMIIDWIVRAVCFLIRYRSGRWKHRAIA